MNGIGKINLRERKINKHFDSDVIYLLSRIRKMIIVDMPDILIRKFLSFLFRIIKHLLKFCMLKPKCLLNLSIMPIKVYY